MLNIRGIIVMCNHWNIHLCREKNGENKMISIYLAYSTTSVFAYRNILIPENQNFSRMWRRHHYRRRAANFDLCSALIVIDQWELFCVQLLWYGISIYNGHLWGLVTLTPIVERLAIELSLPVFTTSVRRGWDSNTQPSTCEANSLTHCATAAVYHKML